MRRFGRSAVIAAVVFSSCTGGASGCESGPPPVALAASQLVVATSAQALPADTLVVSAREQLADGAHESVLVLDAATGIVRLRAARISAVLEPDRAHLVVIDLAASSQATTRVRRLELPNLREIASADVPGSYLGGHFSPSGRFLAISGQVTDGALLETRSLTLVGRFQYETQESLNEVSDDGRTVILQVHMPAGALPAVALDVTTGVRVKAQPRSWADGSRSVDAAGARWAIESTGVGPQLKVGPPVGSAPARCFDLKGSATADAWQLISTERAHSIYAWNAATGTVSAFDTNAQTWRTTWLVSTDGTPRGQPAQAVVSADGATLFLPTQTGLIALATDGVVERWRTFSGVQLSSVALSPDGARLYAITATGEQIYALDVASGGVLGTVPFRPERWENIWTVAR